MNYRIVEKKYASGRTSYHIETEESLWGRKYWSDQEYRHHVFSVYNDAKKWLDDRLLIDVKVVHESIT